MATSGEPAIHEAHLAPSGQVRRVAAAGARSINEPNQPRREGATPQERAASLVRIIDFLAPAAPTHKRYLKRDGMTFCNIYIHDYCHLAGAYLPRVWWSKDALAKIAAGQTVVPKLGPGATVHEVVVNELVGWLGKFAPGFGWRQTDSLTTLQDAANAGAVAIIAAQHKQAGHHGHVVAIAPETQGRHALRTGNDVTTPLQSQAGDDNFSFRASLPNFWTSSVHKNPQFWIHD